MDRGSAEAHSKHDVKILTYTELKHLESNTVTSVTKAMKKAELGLL